MAKKLSLKAKAIQDAAIDAQLDAFEAFHARWDGVIFQAEVLNFDHLRGEALVRGLRLSDGVFTLYACNLPGAKTWYPETACVYHTKGQIIDVELKVSYGSSILVSHTPGTLDQAKWDALDQTKLAFRCDESGKAINGLFSKD